MTINVASKNRDRFVLDVHGAFLRRADLSYANLEGADLSYADCTKAIFRGANFKDAVLNGTILKGADLRDAQNLTAFQISAAVTDETTLFPGYLADVAKQRTGPTAGR